ncbi:MAG: anaerobic ribonucleoside-triphosphate reductase activating protein [Clostridium sp.]|nr:anaerobic ribonucleoside-triphosphate reductase activating protein [Clostridium sp.]
MKLKVAGFLDNTMVNGKGLRSALFLSGCNHNCDECHNKEMQSFQYGDEVEIKEILNRIKSNVPLIKGVTFSGGEPFEQAQGLSILARFIKNEGLNIWCYTGYTLEEIVESGDTCKLDLLSHIDILVDGKFEKNLVEGALKYTGSSNQRIIKLKDVIKYKEIASE